MVMFQVMQKNCGNQKGGYVSGVSSKEGKGFWIFLART